MKPKGPSTKEKKQITGLVEHYVEHRKHFSLVLETLKGHVINDQDLMSHVHSVKWRTKDPEHLRDKLFRKLRDAQSERKPFKITKDNLFSKINDLAGFRILHLHTLQMDQIDKALRRLFAEAMYGLIKGPTART